MPILTLQRRLREAGRIRIGQQVATSNGKKRPAKLDRFRLTSSDRTAIDAAAALYGGEPHPWQDGPIAGHWEVFTEAQSIPVVVPPAAAAFSQWNETWSGGGCTRRCDGERMISLDGKTVDEPCICATEDDGTCKPTTRLNVILGQLPGLGVWRLETHGYYAATELAGTVEVVMGAATRGQLLPASLRLEHREVRRPGQTTRKFVVPLLDIAITPNALGLVLGSPLPALADADENYPATGTWQPIPAPPPPAELGPGDVADRIQHAQKDPPRKRSNSAPPMPRSGAQPRDRDAAPAAPTMGARQIKPRMPTSPLASDAQIMKMQACFTNLGVKPREEKLTFIAAAAGRSVESSKDLTVEEASTVIDLLDGLLAGTVSIEYAADGTMRLAAIDHEQGDAVHAPPPDEAPPDNVDAETGEIVPDEATAT